MKNASLSLLTLGLLLLCACASTRRVVWQWFGFGPSDLADPKALAVADEFLAKMTLDEKLSLTHGNGTMSINAIPRVGLTNEFWFSDGPHTVRRDVRRESFGHLEGSDEKATVLPSLSALAATWDPELARRFGEVLGSETRHRGKDVILGPGVNIMRTPLCGRNFEYMGEDPHLASRMAAPLIQGIQSNDVAACVKHYAVNSQELNRHNVDAVVDERPLREIYLPAFRAAVVEGRSLTVMNAYNRINGVFASHSDPLNNKILKQEWGFPGFLVTDWGGLRDTIAGALGGTDVEMNGGNSIRYFTAPLTEAVESGAIPEALIDDKARRVLYVMAKIHKIGGQPRKPGERNTPAHQQTAREIAAQSIILLKNDTSTLPLDPARLRRILILGQNATEKHSWGGWSAEGNPPYEITPLEGLKNALPQTEIIAHPYPAEAAQAEPVPDSAIITEDTLIRDAGMTVKAWAASFYANPTLSGPPAYTAFEPQPAIQTVKTAPPRPNIPQTDFSARWETRIKAPETGEYAFAITLDDGARLFIDDKPVVNAWSDGSQRTATGTATLTAGATHTLRLEYYQRGGDALLTFGWRLPSQRGIEFQPLIDLAKNADAVILMTGTRHGHGQALECEGADRPNMKLLPQDDRAIATLLPHNPRTVIVDHSGAPVEMPWIAAAPTLVHMSYCGQEAGNALADALLGKSDPGGRLPYTMPARLQDSPAHALNDYNSDRVTHKEGILVGYRWFDTLHITPLFPFGHGLSYTTFSLAPAKLTQKGDTIHIALPVSNTGDRPGSTVIQLYVSDREASVPRPQKELKAFKKVTLQPGESILAELTLTRQDFCFWDTQAHRWELEPGLFDLHIGTSSRAIDQIFEVEW